MKKVDNAKDHQGVGDTDLTWDAFAYFHPYFIFNSGKHSNMNGPKVNADSFPSNGDSSLTINFHTT